MSSSRGRRREVRRSLRILAWAGGVAVGVLVGFLLYQTGAASTLGAVVAGVFSAPSLAVIIELLQLYLEIRQGHEPQTHEEFPFHSCDTCNEALEILLPPGKREHLGFKIPYIPRRCGEIDSILAGKAPGEKQWVLILGGDQSGKTRELAELLKRHSQDYGTLLIYEPGKTLTPIRFDLKLSGSKVLVVVDDLHYRCRQDLPSLTSRFDLAKGERFIDALAELVEKHLEEHLGMIVRVVLTCRNRPSDLQIIGWPKYPFWKRFECVQLGFLSQDEFSKVVNRLAQQVPWKLEDEHHKLIESQWVGAFNPIIGSFSKVDSNIDQVSTHLWKVYERELNRFWEDHIAVAERETPGAEQVFRAIYWLQHLDVPTRLEIVAELVAEWGGKEVKTVERTLTQLEQYALPQSQDAGLMEVMPVRCETGYIEIGAIDAFLQVIESYGESPNVDLLFDFAYKLAVKHDQPQAAVKLWGILTDSSLAGLAYYDMGIAYGKLEEVIASVENFYLGLNEESGLALWIVEEPAYASRFEQPYKGIEERGSAQSKAVEAYRLLCEKLMAIELAIRLPEEPQIRSLLLEISSKAAETSRSIDAVWNQARVLSYLNIQPDAVQAFEQAVRLAPNSVEILVEAAWSRYFVADEIADLRFEEERKEIERAIDEAREKRDLCDRRVRELEEEIRQAQHALTDLRSKLRQIKEESSVLACQPRETWREIESTRNECVERLQLHIQQGGITRRALNTITPLLDSLLERNVITTTQEEELTKVVQLLREHQGFCRSELEEVIGLLSEFDLAASLGSDSFEQNKTRLRRVEQLVANQLQLESDEIGRIQKRVDELNKKLQALNLLAHHKESQTVRRIREGKEVLKSLREKRELEFSEARESEMQVAELSERRERLNKRDFALAECGEALAWARRAYNLNPDTHTRNLVNQIESDLKGARND